MAPYRLDPKNSPRLTEMEQARLASISDAAIAEAALQGADNPPPFAAELACISTSG